MFYNENIYQHEMYAMPTQSTIENKKKIIVDRRAVCFFIVGSFDAEA